VNLGMGQVEMGVYVRNAMASKHISFGIFSYSQELEIDSNR